MQLVRVASPREMRREIERRRATDRMMCAPFFGSGVAAGAKFGAAGAPSVTVTGVFPSWAPLAAGSPLTITGTGFTGTPTVLANGVACTSVVVVSATTITCLTGAGSTGTGVISVAGATGANFTYVNGPLAAWKGEDAPNNGTSVTGNWADWISGKTLVPSGSPLWFASAFNGHASVRLNGTSQTLINSTFGHNQPLEAWLAVKQISWTAFAYIVGAGNTVVLDQDGSTATPDIGLYAGAGPNTPNSALTLGTFGIVRAVWNGASSSIVVNNTTTSTGNPGANNPSGGFGLGSYTDGSGKSNIEAAALVWVDPTATGWSASAFYTAFARDY